MSGLSVDLRLALSGFTLAARFEAPGAGVTSLFGPSASGKTTVLRCMAGLERADHGFVHVNGEVWQDEATGVFLPAHRRRVGYVFQEASLFPHLRVRENMLYGHRRLPPADQRVTFEEAVEWLGVESLLTRRPDDLSGGERQRVAIARALLAGPKLLLLDEPLASLDEPSRDAILPYLARLHEKLSIPVLYVSHSVREVARLADFVVELRDGRVTATGPTAEILYRMAAAPDHGPDMVAILDVTVLHDDEPYHLSEVESAFGRLWIPAQEGGAKAKRRVQISARDVSLGLAQDVQSSILNQLEARVVDVNDAGPGQVLVRLMPVTATEGPYLLSLITRKSLDRLDIQPGMTVHARIKSVSVLE